MTVTSRNRTCATSLCGRGQRCVNDRCQCVNGDAIVTSDSRLICISRLQRLVGQRCLPAIHQCLQRAGTGRTLLQLLHATGWQRQRRRQLQSTGVNSQRRTLCNHWTLPQCGSARLRVQQIPHFSDLRLACKIFSAAFRRIFSTTIWESWRKRGKSNTRRLLHHVPTTVKHKIQ